MTHEERLRRLERERARLEVAQVRLTDEAARLAEEIARVRLSCLLDGGALKAAVWTPVTCGDQEELACRDGPQYDAIRAALGPAAFADVAVSPEIMLHKNDIALHLSEQTPGGLVRFVRRHGLRVDLAEVRAAAEARLAHLEALRAASEES